MKPNFALSLSFEGVRLLRRAKAQWEPVGEVSAASADMDAELAALRALAVADGAEMHSKLILPNEQIKFLTLPTPDATEADVRAALDGATPYAVADLAYDFASWGGRTHVAAVARETLDEAEAFALAHGFGPVSFVAEPPGGSFPGEPLFGLTKGAPELIGKGRRFVRDNDPTKVAPLPVEAAPEVGAAAPEGGAEFAAQAASADVAPDVTAWTAPEAPTERIGVAPVPEAEVAPDLTAAAEPEGSVEPVPFALAPFALAPVPEPGTDGFPGAAVPVADVGAADFGGAVLGGAESAGTDSAVTASATADVSVADVPVSDFPVADAPVADVPIADKAPDAPVSLQPEPAPPPVTDPEPIAARVSPVDTDTSTPDEDAEPVFISRLAALRGDRRPLGERPTALPPAPSAPPPAMAPSIGATPSFGAAAPVLPPPVPAPTLPPLAAAPPLPPLAAVPPVPPLAAGASLPPLAAGRSSEPPALSRPAPAPDMPAPLSPSPASPSPVSPAPVSRPSYLPDAPPLRAARPAGLPLPGSGSAGSGSAGAGSAGPGALPGAGPAAAFGSDGRRAPMNGRTAVPSPAVLAALKAAVHATGKTDSGKVDLGRPIPSLGASLAPIPDLPAPTPLADPPTPKPEAGTLLSRLWKVRAKADTGPKAEAGPKAVTVDLTALPQIAPRKAPPLALSGIGARKPEARMVGGKPRFLGLILTAVLLVCLAGVAAWATLSEGRLSGLWRSAPTEEVSGSVDGIAMAPPALPDAGAAPGAEADPTPDAAEVLLGPDGIAVPEEPGLEPILEPVSEGAPDLPVVEEAPVVPEDLVAEEALVEVPAEVAAAVPADVSEVLPDAVTEPVVAAVAAAAATASATPPATDPATAPVDVLSPAEAERFYAATGVWLRAPRLPLLPQSDSLGPVTVAAPDPGLTRPTAPALPPLAVASPDSTLPVQINPPAPDVTFARDARGFILATEAGTLTPDGMLIYAGSPAVVPPTRPNTVAPVSAPEATPDVTPDADGAAEGAAVPEEGLAAGEAAGLATLPAAEPGAEPGVEPGAAAIEEVVSTAGAVALDGLRPPVRPADLAPVEPEAAEPAAVAFAGPRPPERPEGLAPLPEATDPALAEVDPEAADAVDPATGETTPDELAEGEAAAEPDVEAALAAIVASAPDPLASATPQAVAQASRPDARPQNFDRVVDQAQARIARSQTAAAASTVPEDGEPVAVASASAAVAPTGPVPTSVAAAATVENAINLRDVNLIGVYGGSSDRRALVRLGNGRYVRVAVGDSLDGGQVAEIGSNSLNYIKRGRTVTLEIPSG